MILTGHGWPSRGDGVSRASHRTAAGRTNGGVARGNDLSATSTLRRKHSVGDLRSAARPRSPNGLGVSARPRRSGNAPAEPGRRQPLHLATGSAANRRLQRTPYGEHVRLSGRHGRQLPRQFLGIARHARQQLRVVPGLVPLDPSGRREPRSLVGQGNAESGRHVFPSPPWRVLGRRRVGLSFGVSPTVST